VPGDPQEVRVKAINSTSIRVDWKPPIDKERNGLIRGYHVHVQEIKDEVCVLALRVQILLSPAAPNLIFMQKYSEQESAERAHEV